MQRKATKCQSLNHLATSILTCNGHVAVSLISMLGEDTSFDSCRTTTSMDWSCKPGRFSMGNELDKNNGLGSTGKPCVIYLVSLCRDGHTGGPDAH